LSAKDVFLNTALGFREPIGVPGVIGDRHPEGVSALDRSKPEPSLVKDRPEAFLCFSEGLGDPTGDMARYP
jgi:hypothetical protein